MSQPVRYHGLDLLRGVAMALGVVLHAPLAFITPEIWEAVDVPWYEVPKTEDWVLMLLGWIHQWRMPAFFLLAGFFGLMILRRRGALAFLGDRIVRLGLTLALFGLIIDAINPPIDFELGHLWFLYHLLMICGLASAAFALTRAFPGVLEPVARAVAWPARHVAGLLLYLPLLLLLTIYARPPVRTVIPHYLNEIEPLALAYNTLWFIIGAALFHHRDTITRLAKAWLLALSGVVAAVSMLTFWTLSHNVYSVNTVPLALWLPSSTLATFSWTLFMVGLATRMLNRRNRVVNWFVRVSYPVYVFHLQPSIWIGVIGLSAGMTAGTLMLPTIAISFGSSLLLYYLFVRFTPLEWLFNGHRQAWFRPHWIGLGR
ncbi:MAG: acyltransferase family protein, partial [Pseudomonadota bacterium]|nr:acyltransferase family protein [Pseudomonadota bacterium]